MLLRKVNDWKQFLPSEDEEKLNETLKRVARYRGAYKNADDVKIAQLWCAILELRKGNLILQKKLNRIQFILDGLFERVRKQREKDEEIIKALETF